MHQECRVRERPSQGRLQISFSRILVGLIVGFLLSGCGLDFMRAYPISPIHPEERASLTFTTDTLRESYPYLGFNRRLYLFIYEMEPGEKPGNFERKEYLGSVRVTKEKNSATVPISSGSTLGLQTYYSETVPGVSMTCGPTSPLLLTPKKGSSYVIKHTQGASTCYVRLTEAGKGEPKVIQTASSVDEEPTPAQRETDRTEDTEDQNAPQCDP